MADETWLAVPGYEGRYEASAFGGVRGVTRIIHKATMRHGTRRKTAVYQHRGRPLRASLCNSGYLAVKLWNGHAYQTIMVHRIIASLFVPNPEGKPTVNHKDGNKLNNAANNLEWMTTKENKAHAYRAGLFDNRGERNGGAKLTAESVREIRRLYALGGHTQESLGLTFGVTQTVIGDIVRNRSWVSVT